MSNLAFIPARAGSKRLPSKNLRLMNGKPLIFWTVKQALDSQIFDRVIVSTDSKEIASIVTTFGAEVPMLRPDRLASEESTTHEVLLDLLEKLKVGEGYSPLNVFTLQPTSPLRTSGDIQGAFELFSGSPEADSLVSFTKIPSSLNPSKIMLKSSEGFLFHAPIKPEDYHNPKFPENIYIRNGAAIYISKNENIEAGILSGKILGYEMPWLRSVDIDTLEDFQLAEALMIYQENHQK
jgi:CMP-N,N'-diacetyllegionaminic acid synthase